MPPSSDHPHVLFTVPCGGLRGLGRRGGGKVPLFFGVGCVVGWWIHVSGNLFFLWVGESFFLFFRLWFFLCDENSCFFFQVLLVGGFKYFVFSPLLAKMIQFDYIIFFRWVETTN